MSQSIRTARNYENGTYIVNDLPVVPSSGDNGILVTYSPRVSDFGSGRILTWFIEWNLDGGITWLERGRAEAPLTSDVMAGDPWYFSVEDAQTTPLTAIWRVRMTVSGGPFNSPITVKTIATPTAAPRQPLMNPFTYISATSGVTSGVGTSLTYTPPQNYTATNLLVTCVGVNGAATITAWTLTSETISVGQGVRSTDPKMETRFVQNAVGGHANGCNAQISASSGFSVSVEEFSGADTTDAYDTGGAAGTGTGEVATCGAVTPGAANYLLYAMVQISAANSPAAGTDGQGNNMTAGVATTRTRREHLEEATVQSYAPTFTWTGSTNWVCGADTFIPAAEVAAARPLNLMQTNLG